MKLKQITARLVLPLVLSLIFGVPVFASYISVHDGTISTAKLADGAVTQAKLAARATGTTVAAGGVAISSSSGASSAFGTSYGDIANLQVTITTTGRPVMLMLISDGSGNYSFFTGSSSIGVSVQFLRGSTVISTYLQSPNSNISTGMFNTVDAPAAGTYTYKVQGAATSGTGTVNYAKLVAYEI